MDSNFKVRQLIELSVKEVIKNILCMVFEEMKIIKTLKSNFDTPESLLSFKNVKPFRPKLNVIILTSSPLKYFD